MKNSNTHESKCSLLKELINTSDIGILMEAHNGMSAKVVEEVGFSGIWASGLSISTAYGVRDSNELSFTQNLDVLEAISDSVDIPILFDGDTGYGNFNNARRMVKKLEQRAISGVVIEDKIFPKTNSFIGENQRLADVNEMCGKLAAMCDARQCKDFQIVARCESLISGHGVLDALQRATSYENAGADAIFIHSKKETADEIREFSQAWRGSIPLIATPTTYFKTPFKILEEMGISAVICANHNMRASVRIMREVSQAIFVSQSLEHVEDLITPLSEIFELMNYQELDEANEIYLPKKNTNNAASINGPVPTKVQRRTNFDKAS
ncbi:MAG: phosphoenolpyruvate mutase [Hyphomicrobiales bacterium]|nr:phosphoenolpyruvate mutase [Hyphomicrobiales bacterium]